MPDHLTLLRAARSFRALFQPLMKTFSAKAIEVSRKWWIIDAKDQMLGRVAVKAANLLRGKGKADFHAARRYRRLRRRDQRRESARDRQKRKSRKVT